MIELHVNNDQVYKFTARLKAMHRSDFPIAVRSTLNDLAFDVKKNTLIPSVDKKFILKNPSFFKKFSGVTKADGWNVNSMQSEVGIIKSSDRGGEVASELTNQEYGGKIKHKARYLKYARRGSSRFGRVNSNYNLEKKGYVQGTPKYARNRKANFVAGAFVAMRENKYMNIKSQKGKDTLLIVESISQNIRTKKIRIKLRGIAELNQENKTLKARPFLRPASLLTYQKVTDFYIKNAKKRFERAKK